MTHFLTPSDQIWPDAAHVCESQLNSCSEECVELWLARGRNHHGCAILSLEALRRLSARWYEAP